MNLSSLDDIWELILSRIFNRLSFSQEAFQGIEGLFSAQNPEVILTAPSPFGSGSMAPKAQETKVTASGERLPCGKVGTKHSELEIMSP